jgi:DNA polymerase elongation subunit (family B)
MTIIALDIETYSTNGRIPPFEQLKRGYLEDQIVSVSFAIIEDYPNLTNLTTITIIKDEEELLKESIEVLARRGKGVLLTYNGTNFDIHALLMRSQKYGLDHHLKTALQGYDHIDVFKLVKYMKDKGLVAVNSLKLKNVAEVLKVNNHMKAEIEGKDYFKYYNEWRKELNPTAIFYNQNDAILTLKVFVKLIERINNNNDSAAKNKHNKDSIIYVTVSKILKLFHIFYKNLVDFIQSKG